jgi:hypothetical protein
VKKKPQEDYAAELQKCHDRWQYLYEHGGSDPFWSDGCNLGLVRNHCLYYRCLIEENYAPEDYPAVYFKDIPPEVDKDYMAAPDEIRAEARKSLAAYKADPNYQYIRQHRDDFSPKTQKKLSVGNILGYVSGLESDIAGDRLVDMRRHRTPDSPLRSFADCARKMRELPPEEVQMTLFSLSAGGVEDEPDDEDYDEELDEEYAGISMA